jgi:hypothetical protein
MQDRKENSPTTIALTDSKSIRVDINVGLLPSFSPEFLGRFGGAESEFVRAISDVFTRSIAQLMKSTRDLHQPDDVRFFSDTAKADLVADVVASVSEPGVFLREATGAAPPGAIENAFDARFGAGKFGSWLRAFEALDHVTCLEISRGSAFTAAVPAATVSWTKLRGDFTRGFLPFFAPEFLEHFGGSKAQFVRALSDSFTRAVASAMREAGELHDHADVKLLSDAARVHLIQKLLASIPDQDVFFQEAVGRVPPGSIAQAVDRIFGAQMFTRWLHAFEGGDRAACLAMMQSKLGQSA